RKYRIFNHWYPVFFSNFHLCLHSFAVMVRISHRENFRLIPTERQNPGGSNPIPAVVSRSAYGKDPFRIMVLQEHVHDGKGGTFHQDRRRHVLMFYGMCVAAAHLNGSHQFLHDVSSSRMHQSDTAKRQKDLLRCFHCAKKEKVMKWRPVKAVWKLHFRTRFLPDSSGNPILRSQLFVFRLITGEIVGKAHQTFGKMNVLYNKITRQGKVQISMCKIPECLYAAVCKELCHLQRLCFRQSQSGNLHIVFADKVRKFIGHADRNPADADALQHRVDIEDAHGLKTAAVKRRVICQCLSEITGTDDDHIMGTVQTEDLSNLCVEVTDVISVALLSEAAKIVQILSNL